MEKATADLGSFCLVSTTADLELQLHSHARFSTNDSRFTVEELTDRALNSDARSKPWVVQNDTFKLVISLGLDDTDVAPHSTMQAFTQRLYDSRMWHQLSLTPISITLSDTNVVAIHISRSMDESRLTVVRQQNHKLSDGLSRAVHPPANVPNLQFDEVLLTLHVAQIPSSKRQKLGLSETNESDSIDADFADEPDHAGHAQYLPTIARCATRLESDVGGLGLVNGSPIATNDFVVPRSKCAHSRSDLGQQSVTYLQREILKILDAGIRHAVAAIPPRAAKDIILTESKSVKHLADIAPSIWSPGCFKAISDRSLLLPTISDALNSVGIVHARSTTLRAKTAEIARRNGCLSAVHFTTSGSSERPQLQTAQLSMGSRFWMAAQSALFEKTAAPQLKALALGPDSGQGAINHEMLDMDDTAEVEDREHGYASDDSMMGLDDSGYCSDFDLLSAYEPSQPLSPHTVCEMEFELARDATAHGTPVDIEEEMLLI